MTTLDDEDPPGSAAWWLAHGQRQERRHRQDGLTVDVIVAAALAIVESEGAEALTMRRVARNLATGPASLYRHIGGRDELVALVVDHVLGTMAVAPVASGGWRAQFEAAARRFRAHLLAHIEVVPLIRSVQMLGPNSMAGRETALGGLLEIGLAPGDAVAAYLAIVHFTVANVQLDGRAHILGEGGRGRLRELFAAQDPERFPHVVDEAQVLAAHTTEAEFEFGLAAILDRVENLATTRR